MFDDDGPGDRAAAHDESAARRDLERAIRGLVLSDHDTRDALLQLAARVVALTDELTRRLDGVEPLPAPPNTPAAPPTGTIEAAVEAAMERVLPQIRAADANDLAQVSIDTGGDKYATAPIDLPCAELLPLCGARCCKLTFPLSTADLDEGIVRWDYGRPYQIRQRKSDGYCVHNDPQSRGCTIHHARPRPCRSYDCREDPRIWLDFDRRIPAPADAPRPSSRRRPTPPIDLFEQARARRVGLWFERNALHQSPAGGDDPPDDA